jgi:YD repeat-containing protein
MIVDSEGHPFDPNSCFHAYSYDANGYLVADTCADQDTGIVRVKTYTQVGRYLFVQSAWMRQDRWRTAPGA